MNGERLQRLVLYVSSAVWLLSYSPATAEAGTKREATTSTRDHIQNVLETRDPRSLWLLLWRSGIVAMPGFVLEDAAQGFLSSRLTSGDSPSLPSNRVTVQSCGVLIQSLSSRIDDWFEELFEATPARARPEVDRRVEQVKSELYKRSMECLMKRRPTAVDQTRLCRSGVSLVPVPVPVPMPEKGAETSPRKA